MDHESSSPGVDALAVALLRAALLPNAALGRDHVGVVDPAINQAVSETVNSIPDDLCPRGTGEVDTGLLAAFIDRARGIAECLAK